MRTTPSCTVASMPQKLTHTQQVVFTRRVPPATFRADAAAVSAARAISGKSTLTAARLPTAPMPFRRLLRLSSMGPSVFREEGRG